MILNTEAQLPILRKAPILKELSAQLTESLCRPSPRTLRLIERALSYLSPFESSKSIVTSASEKEDLLELLDTHRLTLSPYLDLDRIESNLRHRY